MRIEALLSPKTVEYACPFQQEVVRLVCLWHLDTEQGAECQLSPITGHLLQGGNLWSPRLR